MLSLDSHPLPPPTWEGERIASASAPMRAQSATVEDGRNERSRKIACGFFCFISFAREARRTAPRSENRIEIVRCQKQGSCAEPLPAGEANDAIHFDMTITFNERRCVFRFAHTGLSQIGNKWGNRRNHVTVSVT